MEDKTQIIYKYEIKTLTTNAIRKTKEYSVTGIFFLPVNIQLCKCKMNHIKAEINEWMNQSVKNIKYI